MNNVKKQKGFTLIELMIVVTIIGILASIAVPVYRDYTIRSRVSECASVFGTLKTEMSMFNSNNGNMPTNLTQLAIEGRVSSNPLDYEGDYVSSMVVTNGSVRCTLQNLVTLGSAAGEYVSFDIGIAGITISWTVGGSVEDRYLPVLN